MEQLNIFVPTCNRGKKKKKREREREDEKLLPQVARKYQRAPPLTERTAH